MKRIDKENYYLDIAETVLERSTCLRRCCGIFFDWKGVRAALRPHVPLLRAGIFTLN